MTEKTTKQKHLNFPDEHIAIVEKFQATWDTNFTKAVLLIIEKFDKGIQLGEDDIPEPSNNGFEERLLQLEKNFSYFHADETDSKVGNLELKVKEFEKELTVLKKVSKVFKKHYENRDIHLQD